MGPLPIWSRPSPVGLRLQDSVRTSQPAILRFDHDDFMQEYIDTLQSESERLGEWLVQPETWRAPMPTPKHRQPEPESRSKIEFVYDQTHRLTQSKKPLLPSALNVQTFKGGLLKRKGLPAVSALSEELLPLKLFQSTHKRHYLVSASLISEEPGLPDCEPEIRQREKAVFVLRRLLPPEDTDGASGDDLPLEHWDEYAFIPGPRGNKWHRLGEHRSASVRRLAAGEEELPLFPVSYLNNCNEQRRLLSGVIPVSRREAWVGAGLGGHAAMENETAGPTDTAVRSLAGFLFQTDVVAPWKLLLEQAEFKQQAAGIEFSNFDTDTSAKSADNQRLMRSSRDEIQTGSWYILLDFARFLQTHLPAIWQTLRGQALPQELDEKEQELVVLLQATGLSWPLASAIVTYPYLFIFDPFGLGAGIQPIDSRYNYLHIKWSLAHALIAAAEAEQGLEAVEGTFTRFDEAGDTLDIDSNWPAFLFPLADPELAAPTPAVVEERLSGLSGLDRTQTAVDVLAEMIEALLPAGEAAEELIDTVPVGDPREAWFVVRCVYQRPNCGPLFPALLSEASQKFQMAAFFDPDAPSRPVRIPMPVDISPAGLRKYQKNTGFVMSDMLCGKLKRIRKMTFADLVLSVLPWPFHKDLPDPSGGGSCQEDGNSFGMICSLSIPIVTLCAMILLIIIVALFDLFFRWIPYLFVCLPIPGLKGKVKSP